MDRGQRIRVDGINVDETNKKIDKVVSWDSSN